MGDTKEKRINPNRKVERNNKVITLIVDDGKSYTEIAEQMGVSKARVQQIAKSKGISKWTISREKYRVMAENITKDLAAGISYQDINRKYNVKKYSTGLKKYNLNALSTKLKITRNENIVNRYKSITAKSIINSTENGLVNPNKLSQIDSVYAIASKLGYKKFPGIGNRNGGGVFEDKKIIKLIKDKRDIEKLSFRAIAEYLNDNGIKTVTGKLYSTSNLNAKYKAIKKHNL
jgi:hypothetical protein